MINPNGSEKSNDEPQKEYAPNLPIGIEDPAFNPYLTSEDQVMEFYTCVVTRRFRLPDDPVFPDDQLKHYSHVDYRQARFDFEFHDGTMELTNLIAVFPLEIKNDLLFRKENTESEEGKNVYVTLVRYKREIPILTDQEIPEHIEEAKAVLLPLSAQEYIDLMRSKDEVVARKWEDSFKKYGLDPQTYFFRPVEGGFYTIETTDLTLDPQTIAKEINESNPVLNILAHAFWTGSGSFIPIKYNEQNMPDWIKDVNTQMPSDKELKGIKFVNHRAWNTPKIVRLDNIGRPVFERVYAVTEQDVLMLLDHSLLFGPSTVLINPNNFSDDIGKPKFPDLNVAYPKKTWITTLPSGQRAYLKSFGIKDSKQGYVLVGPHDPYYPFLNEGVDEKNPLYGACSLPFEAIRNMLGISDEAVAYAETGLIPSGRRLH